MGSCRVGPELRVTSADGQIIKQMQFDDDKAGEKNLAKGKYGGGSYPLQKKWMIFLRKMNVERAFLYENVIRNRVSTNLESRLSRPSKHLVLKSFNTGNHLVS